MAIVKIFLVIILAGIITVQSVIALELYSNPQVYEKKVEGVRVVKTSDKSELDLEIEAIQNIEKAVKPVEDLYITGWIPDWDIPDGITSIQNSDNFDSISPVWFLVNNNGSLKKTAYTNGPAMLALVVEKKLKLYPTISLFNRDTLSEVLNSKENRTRHISEIMQNVIAYDYDGIDIDYEEVYLKDKKLFFDFLEELSIKLHTEGKKLIFSPLAKWGDHLELTGTKMVFDYKRIADLVDEFRIQGYGYTVARTQRIAPIGPLPWLEDVIRYAIKEGVPREKIVLGIHTYAYDWSERPTATVLDYYKKSELQPFIEGLEDGDAYYFKSVESVMSKYDFTYKFNDLWGEAVGTYIYQDKPRTVVFPTDDSLKLRKQLAADYGLKGIAYWRIGDEGNLKL